MKVKCLNNTGKILRKYEEKTLRDNEFGRFGASEFTQFNLEIGREYLVMGMIMFKSYLSYLVDDNGEISACPCQLFEVVDDKVNSNWYFRLIDNDEQIYPYVQAIWGYAELCFDKLAYENLIVDRDEETMRTYFRRKIELEKELSDPTS